MNQILNQLFKLPLQFFVANMDLMLDTMRQFQATVNEAADLIVVPQEHILPAELFTDRQSVEEIKQMYDEQDLGGDDLKVVEYSIFFRKAGHEATFVEGRTETINYSTNGADYAALKISEFTSSFSETNKRTIPSEWAGGNHPKDKNYKYDDYDAPTEFGVIPPKHRAEN